MQSNTVTVPYWCEKVIITKDPCGWIVSLHGDSHGIGVANTELASGPTLTAAVNNCIDKHEGWTRFAVEQLGFEEGAQGGG